MSMSFIIVMTYDENVIPTFERIYHIRDGRTFEGPGERLMRSHDH